MNVLVLLPFAPFEQVDFERLLVCVRKRFKDSEVILCCHRLSLDYYAANYPDSQFKVMIDNEDTFNYLTRELVQKSCSEYAINGDYVVVVANNREQKISAKPILSEKLPVYRWYRLDGRIWSIYEEIDEDEDPEINTHIFNKMAKKGGRGLFRLLPFGYMHRTTGFGYINEFGFRVPKDYQKLKQRDNNHKLICVFGGSTCFSMGVYEDEMWSARLEYKLNRHSEANGLSSRYTVLNFGMMGHVVLDQIQTYIMFAYELNPDAIISYDGWNDIVCGMTSDEYLKDKFSYNYMYLYEEWSKILANSNERLAWGRGNSFVNPKSYPLTIARSYHTRKKQFEKMANEAGIKFFSVFQPVYISKSAHSDREKEGYNYFTDDGMKRDMEYVRILYTKILKYLEGAAPFECHLDLHSIFYKYGIESTFFMDSAHTMPDGDEAIAENIFDFIRSWCMHNG